MRKCILIFFLFIFVKPLLAHHKVYGARVHKGDREISWRGHVDYDNRSNKKFELKIVIAYLESRNSNCQSILD